MSVCLSIYTQVCSLFLYIRQWNILPPGKIHEKVHVHCDGARWLNVDGEALRLTCTRGEWRGEWKGGGGGEGRAGVRKEKRRERKGRDEEGSRGDPEERGEKGRGGERIEGK